ncbi:MAG: purine-nucleoside phosphorylase [Lachnospiraceae bacterium]|nr:purine-nucleoside phosphorylase [Lachnospiraceae bacterium]
MADEIMTKLNACVRAVKEQVDFTPQVALILGSGLGDYADQIEVAAELPYDRIPGFPVSTVPGHSGKFIFGTLGGVKLVCMKGRVHYYEGYSMSDVVLPVRLMKMLGAQTLFLTNAAGGLNPDFKPGSLMMLRDHISFFVPNPLLGKNPEELGTRFPDMSEVYSKRLCEIIQREAKAENVPLFEGVYAQLTGPSYESPAEIRALKGLGVDAVGMSTVVEAIAARHAGMEICGISCISNLAAGLSAGELNHKEVQEAADEAAPRFTRLLNASIKAFGQEIL